MLKIKWPTFSDLFRQVSRFSPVDVYSLVMLNYFYTPVSVNASTLVSVVLALEGSLLGETHVIGLHIAHLAQVSVDVLQVKKSDLLVQDLRESVDANVELAGGAELDVLFAESLVLGLVQHDLGKDLVGEGAGHDE